jgi:putative flippase GtrA
MIASPVGARGQPPTPRRAPALDAPDPPCNFRASNTTARAHVITQFGRFVLVGGLATALQYVVLVVLAEGAGLAPVPASSVGFVLSAFANYALNRRFTFAADVPHATGLPRFALVAASGLALNALVMAAATGSMRLHYVLAQVAATVIVLGWNFLLHRHWTFAGARR